MTAPSPLKIKIQLYCGDEIAMGPGKADLLDAIRARGSISAAGRVLGLSYRRAWTMVDTMNRCWAEPLVDTVPGKSKGGGAVLTCSGEAVLGHYRAVQDRLAGAADCPDSQSLALAMLDCPRSRPHGGG